MIKKLAVYLREFSRDAWLAPMFILLEVGCEMIQPLIMAKMIDEGINGTAGLPFILRCGAALILECLERGLYPSWDAHDTVSLALAEQLGYQPAGPYRTFLRLDL